jgi:hypothetical protein
LFRREPSADEDEPEIVEEGAYSTPLWFGPPQDELGVAVPQTLVLARSSRAVVALPYVVAYSTGVTFELVALARGVKQSRVNAIFHRRTASTRTTIRRTTFFGSASSSRTGHVSRIWADGFAGMVMTSTTSQRGRCWFSTAGVAAAAAAR